MNTRYDFVYVFDGKDGDPNGDPDAANAPRIAEACKVSNLPDFKSGEGKWDTKKAKDRSQADIRTLQRVNVRALL